MVERCLEYDKGRRFILDECVSSSPMYCDRFRPVIRYTADAIGPNGVRLAVDAQIIYLSKINFLLKKFIEGNAYGNNTTSKSD